MTNRPTSSDMPKALPLLGGTNFVAPKSLTDPEKNPTFVFGLTCVSTPYHGPLGGKAVFLDGCFVVVPSSLHMSSTSRSSPSCISVIDCCWFIDGSSLSSCLAASSWAFFLFSCFYLSSCKRSLTSSLWISSPPSPFSECQPLELNSALRLHDHYLPSPCSHHCFAHLLLHLYIS